MSNIEPYYSITGDSRGIDLYGVFSPEVQIQINCQSTFIPAIRQTVVAGLTALPASATLTAEGTRVKFAAVNITCVAEITRAIAEPFSGVQINGVASISANLTATRFFSEFINCNTILETVITKIARGRTALSGRATLFGNAQTLDSAFIEINCFSNVFVFFDDFPGTRAAAQIFALSRVLISDPVRYSDSITEDSGPIRTLISIDGRPLTAQSRKFSESIEKMNTENKNWRGRTGRYSFKKNNRKTLSINWDFIPGQREYTVDLNESRDYISNIAQKRSSVLIGFHNLDSSGTETSTVEYKEFFVNGYNEEVVRRDLNNNIYFWKCSITMAEA
jgi:hypothetical protein